MLTKQRLKARYSHWLVYPPEAATHRGLQPFPTWQHEEAAEHVRHTEGEAQPGGRRTQERVFPCNHGKAPDPRPAAPRRVRENVEEGKGVPESADVGGARFKRYKKERTKI